LDRCTFRRWSGSVASYVLDVKDGGPASDLSLAVMRLAAAGLMTVLVDEDV